jgi:hypothetical protein
LSSCYGPKTLLKLYKEAVLHHKKQGGTINFHFKAASASEYDKAMYGGYMRLIIMRSLPISYVEDSDVYNHPISRKIFKEVLFKKAVELVEESITEEVATTQCGSIVHDGWTTCNGTHYISLFAA